MCGAYGVRIRQLFLLDNMSLVLCLSRGRARSFEVLVVIRKIYSYCMARGVRPYFRWIPSELNSSDDPSRLRDENHSSLATRAIEHLRFESEALSAQEVKPPAPSAANEGQAMPCVDEICGAAAIHEGRPRADLGGGPGAGLISPFRRPTPPPREVAPVSRRCRTLSRGAAASSAAAPPTRVKRSLGG